MQKTSRMKPKSLLLLFILLPLLFTSCLADYLNEKFGYSAPIYVSYSTKYGNAPSRKQIAKGAALTSDYLPKLYADDNEFEGWFLDSDFYSIAQEGYIVNESITLYAKWKYETIVTPSNNTIIEVYFNMFDPDSGNGFVQHPEYTRFYYSEADANNADYYIPGYELIPPMDEIYQNFNGYDENGQPMYVTVIQRYYYDRDIHSSSLARIDCFLPDYPDFTYTFYFTDLYPDLNMMHYAGLPKIILHMENCTDLTEIPNGAFGSCSWLSQIYLPYTITKIDSAAFSNCSNLNFVGLQEGLNSIGDSAFESCSSLCSIYLPSTVTSLGQSSFAGCMSLSVAEISSISVEEILSNCFLNCQQLESIRIPYGTMYIYENAFTGCVNLRSLYLPSSIKKIVDDAFLYCNNLSDIYYQGDEMSSTIEIYDVKINELINAGHWHYGQY